ncbi:MAG TPA: hypothetical protein VFQ97_00715 [Gallionella sp.]|nr:hypothetical protein [Gallionella sp.]
MSSSNSSAVRKYLIELQGIIVAAGSRRITASRKKMCIFTKPANQRAHRIHSALDAAAGEMAL